MYQNNRSDSWSLSCTTVIGLAIPLKWRGNSTLPGFGNTKGGKFYEAVLKECHLRNEDDTIWIHKNIRVLETPAGVE